jgi:PIN domain nuclease of toxin-antitoxin system
MRVLLDTNAFIRAVSGTLPVKIERRLLKPGTEFLISIVTPWEIAAKQELHRMGFTHPVVVSKISEMGARLLPISLEHTAELYQLPLHHKDPFDRIIIAQALVEDCPLVSSDQRFPLYSSTGLKVLWDD